MNEREAWAYLEELPRTMPEVTRRSVCMSKREFLGDEFYAQVQQWYDESRQYLKNCGRPKDEVDRYMIAHHKLGSKVYGRMLKDAY